MGKKGPFLKKNAERLLQEGHDNWRNCFLHMLFEKIDCRQKEVLKTILN